MRGNLVTEEIEIDPVLGFAAHLAADDVAIEVARRFLVVDCEGHVEGDHGVNFPEQVNRTSQLRAGKKLSAWRSLASRIKIALP